jgi:hypothetical protein
MYSSSRRAILQTDGVVEAENCTFVANHADDGGAVLVNGGSARFATCCFERNTAALLAGAIFLSGAAHVTT